MRVLGVDPSLTNLGYVVLDGKTILQRGRLQTTPDDGLLIQRCALQARRIIALVEQYEVQHIAQEAPIMQAFSTEILYALQSILHIAYWKHKLRVLSL